MSLHHVPILPCPVPEPAGELLGHSPAMQRVHRQIEQVAASSASVLILGETGTGKELAARLVHQQSHRASGPFVVVNCGALPDQLLESELFGFERGAFTGAVQRRRGKAELATGGTLFLDEVGELSLAGQVKLLRLLQERSLERLGGEATIPVNIRIVAATHNDLAGAVAEKRFRDDLFYRLNVFPITLPPLRERASDIPLLAQHFLAKYRAPARQRIAGFAPEAFAAMEQHPWPGNVRQLQNVVERAVLVAEHEWIEAADLGLTASGPQPLPMASNLRQAAENLERQRIEGALREAAGSKTRSARSLGISERVMRYKIQKYGIDCRVYRSLRLTSAR